jgi:hypothetical protein
VISLVFLAQGVCLGNISIFAEHTRVVLDVIIGAGPRDAGRVRIRQ